MMWDYLTPHSIIQLQRAAALQAMGEQARELLEAGDGPAADRVLDEMNARRAAWETQSA